MKKIDKKIPMYQDGIIDLMVEIDKKKFLSMTMKIKSNGQMIFSPRIFNEKGNKQLNLNTGSYTLPLNHHTFHDTVRHSVFSCEEKERIFFSPHRISFTLLKKV